MTSDKARKHAADQDEPIAIVGMGGIFPQAPDVGQYWKNILDSVDAVADAPPDWDGDLYYDPDSDANDRIYTKKGGFLRDLAVFDPTAVGATALPFAP